MPENIQPAAGNLTHTDMEVQQAYPSVVRGVRSETVDRLGEGCAANLDIRPGRRNAVNGTGISEGCAERGDLPFQPDMLATQRRAPGQPQLEGDARIGDAELG